MRKNTRGAVEPRAPAASQAETLTGNPENGPELRSQATSQRSRTIEAMAKAVNPGVVRGPRPRFRDSDT